MFNPFLRTINKLLFVIEYFCMLNNKLRLSVHVYLNCCNNIKPSFLYFRGLSSSWRSVAVIAVFGALVWQEAVITAFSTCAPNYTSAVRLFLTTTHNVTKNSCANLCTGGHAKKHVRQPPGAATNLVNLNFMCFLVRVCSIGCLFCWENAGMWLSIFSFRYMGTVLIQNRVTALCSLFQEACGWLFLPCKRWKYASSLIGLTLWPIISQ